MKTGMRPSMKRFFRVMYARWCSFLHGMRHLTHMQAEFYDDDNKLIALACCCGRVFWVREDT